MLIASPHPYTADPAHTAVTAYTSYTTHTACTAQTAYTAKSGSALATGLEWTSYQKAPVVLIRDVL